MMEFFGGLSMSIILIYLILKFIINKDDKRRYYEEELARLSTMSSTFRNQNISISNLTVKQLQGIAENAAANQTIRAEVKQHLESKKVSEASNNERNWYVFNTIDEVIHLFDGKTSISKQSLVERMRLVYANQSAIEQRIKEYEQFGCIRKGGVSDYHLTRYITNLNRTESNTISIEDYLDVAKREAFRNILA